MTAADYVYFKEGSQEQSFTLPDGRTMTVVTMWLDRSAGVAWEMDPKSVGHFYYLDGESITGEEAQRALNPDPLLGRNGLGSDV